MGRPLEGARAPLGGPRTRMAPKGVCRKAWTRERRGALLDARSRSRTPIAVQEGTMGLVREFRDFAMKGNVLDLAVGVIIGGAFGKIVESLVKDVLMPLIGLFLGGVNFSGLSLQVRDAAVRYGSFVQAAFDFAIIAFVLFVIIRAANRMKKAPAAAPPSPPPPPEDVVLLREIRDALRRT